MKYIDNIEFISNDYLNAGLMDMHKIFNHLKITDSDVTISSKQIKINQLKEQLNGAVIKVVTMEVS